MVERKTMVSVKFRLRQNLLRSLQREAKKHDRSFNEEVERRLESSFGLEVSRAERSILLSLLKAVLLAAPEANAKALEAVDKLEHWDEHDFQKYDLPDILPPVERKKPRTG